MPVQKFRSIGCPEQTINDIITADVKAVFDARRSTARSHAASSDQATRLVQALEREELEAKRLLLPPTSASASFETGPAARRTAESLSHEELLAYFTRRDETDGQTRLIYADIDPTDAELRELYELGIKFDEQFGHTQPGLADAHWDKRRRAALQQVEDQLRALIGYPRYNEYLREATMRGQSLP